MTCWDGFGNLNDGRPFLLGNFHGTGWLTVDRELLFYSPTDHNWWLGGVSGGELVWTLVGNTAAFGNLADGRPIWTGNFDGTGGTDVLFYSPSDHNWWLGSLTGGQLTWRGLGNTAGFGDLADGRPIWIGDFSGAGGADVLFYSPSDHNWWLGVVAGGLLTWTLAGNTAGFGDLADGRPFYLGYFSNYTRAQLMFYSPSDHNWWLGSFASSGVLTWQLAGNTAGFGNVDDGRPFWVNDFNADLREDILFYYPADGNWWLGTISSAGDLTWALVGNTNNLGSLWPNSRFFTGYFNGVFRSDILFYHPADGNWWLGTLAGTHLTWSLVGNTSGFGNLMHVPIRQGFFKGSGGIDLLFYQPGDGNWWLGSVSGGNLGWTGVGNTGAPFARRIRVHFKLLATPTTPVSTHFDDLKSLYGSSADILVELGTVEDLTAPNPVLDTLRDLNVGDCRSNIWPFPSTTGAQNLLFANRNNVGNDDIVVYIVRTLVATGDMPGFITVGCATHPDGLAGCAVMRSVDRFVIAHEVGHVLGLHHVNDTDNLMNPVEPWTNPPPDIDSGEAGTMRGSGLAKTCP